MSFTANKESNNVPEVPKKLMVSENMVSGTKFIAKF